MRLDRLTQRSQEAMQVAQEMVREHSNTQMEPEHLLLTLLDQEESLAETLLSKSGTEVGHIREQVREAIEALPKVYGDNAQIYASSAFQKMVDQAWHPETWCCLSTSCTLS